MLFGMSAGFQIIEYRFPQGEYFTREILYRENTGKENWEDEEPVDLSGWKARADFRRQRSSGNAPEFSLTTENGGIILSGTEGIIRLLIEDTADLSDVYYSDIFLFTPNGDPIRFLKIQLTLDESVSI